MKGPKIPTKITVVCKLWGAKVHVYQVCSFRNRTELYLKMGIGLFTGCSWWSQSLGLKSKAKVKNQGGRIDSNQYYRY